MKTQHQGVILIVVIVILFLCPLNLFAVHFTIGYDNWYEIKSLNNTKIGYSFAKLYSKKYKGEQVYQLEGAIHLSFDTLFAKHFIHYTDSAIVDDKGVLHYEINENNNGKVRFISANRKGGNLEVYIFNKKDGAQIDKKIINLNDYDYTLFESLIPIASTAYKIGEIKRYRVFVPSINTIVHVEVLAKSFKNVFWNGATKRVLTLEMTSKQKGEIISKTTSWILENGELLFSQAKDYSLHLTTKEKALSIK